MCKTVGAAKTESECASESAPDAGWEESKHDTAEDDDSMTCRICLSGYKVGLYQHFTIANYRHAVVSIAVKSRIFR